MNKIFYKSYLVSILIKYKISALMQIKLDIIYNDIIKIFWLFVAIPMKFTVAERSSMLKSIW